jgi:hypothetical protein
VSAAAWIRRLRDRPIAERERRTALATVAVLLAASTIVLAGIRPAAQSRHPAPRRPVASPASTSRPPTPTANTTPAASRAPVALVGARAARAFLAGYLAYLYGHAPATAVRDATPMLLRSLRAHRPLVSPAMRARYPRVLSLHAVSAPAGLVGVSALVNDGELVSYPVGLVLTPRKGGLLVSALQGAS